MASSLESLVGNLAKSDLSKFIETKKEFGEKIELLRKGIYPYDYMNGIKKFEEIQLPPKEKLYSKLNDCGISDEDYKFEETQLPPKEKLYSKLNDCGISDEDYDHAKKVWEEFEVKNMGEYHNLYLKSDVLLLADVFEEFRNVCLENYSLDPAWYYTSPG